MIDRAQLIVDYEWTIDVVARCCAVPRVVILRIHGVRANTFGTEIFNNRRGYILSVIEEDDLVVLTLKYPNIVWRSFSVEGFRPWVTFAVDLTLRSESSSSPWDCLLSVLQK